MWDVDMLKAMVRALEMFREKGPRSKRIYDAAWAMGKAMVWAL